MVGAPGSGTVWSYMGNNTIHHQMISWVCYNNLKMANKIQKIMETFNSLCTFKIMVVREDY